MHVADAEKPFMSKQQQQTRTADMLSQAVGRAEDRGLQAALRKCREERRHGVSADGLSTAHDELQVAQVPSPPLLRSRLPAW
jgi:hypothetical protein